MTTLGRQFSLHLQFAANAWAKPALYEDFLMGIPGLLKGLAYKIVDFDVLSYERTAQTNLRLNVIVFPPNIDEDLVDQARRLGLRDPVQAAASSAMMLWLRSLQLPSLANPLHGAWRTWCALAGQTVPPTEKAPLYLHCYGLRAIEAAPETEYARSEATTDPVNLTDPYWLPRARHDGSAQAST